jgi:hypothetical protein
VTVTAAGLPAWVSVTPIVWVPLPQACWTALAASSEVMIAASSAYWPSPCEPSATRTCKRDLAGHLGMPEVTLDHWVRRGWATGYLHPEARLRAGHADPAEVKRLRALHQVPRGQHNRRPWLSNQAASMNTEREGADDNADEPRL